MSNDFSVRRMTLRQLLTHTDKCARDLQEQIYASLLTQLSDFRDLSRPVRRRSHYPTMLAMNNALRKLLQANEEAKGLARQLEEYLSEIREHAKRELVNRA
jgi:C4-dicarboxylate-specific signal transduction histidine kinase